MKKCYCCGLEKPLEDFYRSVKMKDGRQPKCKICEKEIRKSKRLENPGYYYKLNPDYYKEYLKTWNQENKESVQEIQRRHYHKKLKKDPVYMLRASVGSRLRQSLKTNNKQKLGTAVDYLGCDYNQLKQHLESQFQEGMSWENYGEWEIDHIHPISKGGTFHFSNLQPLWWQDNLKKSNKLLDS